MQMILISFLICLFTPLAQKGKTSGSSTSTMVE